MKAYSEIIGSFKRTGPFSIESDYIFETESELKDFFALPENKAILHKGLLKIVEADEDGNQALYWVTRKKTNNELEFTKLVTSQSGGDISDLIERLDQEIQDRIDGDDAIWGIRDHTLVPEDLNSLFDLSEAVTDLRDRMDKIEATDQGWDAKFKAIIGTDEEDYIAYLATLDYPSLTALSTNLHKFLEEFDPADDKINTLPELQAFLDGYTDKDTLADILQNLHEDIWGDPFPTEPFRTLRGIEDFVREFKSQSENTDENLQTELDQTQIGVGLSGDGSYNPDKETHYLKDATSVMNALKIIDSLINEAINNVNLQVADTNSIDMNIDKQVDKTILSADVRISTVDGNGVVVKDDGLFYKLTTDYKDGVLTVKVNDNIISQHVIGLSTIVEDATYDPDTEEIVIVFKLLNGDKQTLRIPVGTLIREWEIDNSHPTKVVVLEKTETLGGGTDKLSADVRLYVDKYNILVKQGNTLYVKGTTDNISHKDTSLETVIDNMQAKETATQTALDAEIVRAKEAEQKIATDLTAENVRAEAAEAQLRNDLTAEVTRATTAEKALSDRIDVLDTGSAAEIAALKTKVDNEIKRSTDKDNEHDLAITNEVNRAQTAEQAIDSKLDAEITRAKSEESAIQREVTANKTAIDAEVVRAKAAEQVLTTDLANEIQRSTTKDAALDVDIAKVASDLVAENTRAEAAEKVNADAIAAEITRAKDVEQKLTTDLAAETLRSINKDAEHDAAITAEVTRAKAAEQQLTNDLTAEVTRATTAEAGLLDKINANTTLITDETTRAKAAEKVLTDNLAAEITRSTNEDTRLDKAITDEVTRAKAAEQKVASDLTTEVTRAKGEESRIETKAENLVDVEKTRAEAVEATLDAKIDSTVKAEADRAKGEEARIEAKAENLVNVEKTRAMAAEKVNTDAIAAEVERAKLAEKTNADNIATNATAITNETSRALTAEGTLNNAIVAEVDRAKAAEAALDAKIAASGTSNTLTAIDTKSVDITVAKDADGTTIKADVIVSDQAGNIIKALNSGLYASATMAYNAATNVLTFNNGVATTNLQLSAGSLINSISYDKTTESLVLKYTDAQGNEKTVTVPLTDLINEWTVSNTVDNPIQLTKTRSVSGTDTLSASLSVDQSSTSLLRVEKGFLVASNNAVDIVYKDSTSVYKAITDEINRATSQETSINTTLGNHIGNTNNPHSVTKAQVGLGNVQNLAPADMPISTLQQAKFTAIDTLVATKANSKDLTDHTGNHNNPHAVTKAQVGLANVDNTSDINKPVSTATQAALDKKANIASPVFTGIPQAPSPDSADISNRIATTSWVNKEIGRLIWGDYE